LVPGIAAEMQTRQSLFEVMRDVYGIEAQRRWSRASLDLPPPQVVDALGLEGTPPTWLLEGVNERRDSPREAVEFTRTWMRADVLNVMFEMGRPPEIVRREVRG
jgi:DNA-binding GntR family transcriptional regulator